jgi:dTMP kinase
MERGKFIVIEGADGSGTTSQVELLGVSLSKVIGTKNVVMTEEPSSGEIGRSIRKILGGEKATVPPQPAMELLFRADRLDHIDKKIRPALRTGKWVVCDRYYPSTLVYQGIRDTAWESMVAMVNMSRRFKEDDKILMPDLIILLDGSLDVMTDRRAQRAQRAKEISAASADIFPSRDDTEADEEMAEEIYEDELTQKKVVHLYQLWASGDKYAQNRVLVDADLPLKVVALRCFDVVKKLFFSQK